MQKGTMTVGGIIQFGSYNWRILDIQNDKALIITEDIIEERAYGDRENETWEKCWLRGYLNGGFLQKFSPEEQARVVETRIDNSNCPYHEKEGSKYVADKVFILNAEEVEKYFGFVVEHQWCSIPIPSWWLRGSDCYHAGVVGRDGKIHFWDGPEIFHNDGLTYGDGVRPALWLNIG